MDIFLVKVRSLVLGILILASLFLILLLLIGAVFTLTEPPEQAASGSSAPTLLASAADSPNTVTIGMSKMLNQFAVAVNSVGQVTRSTLGSIGSAIADGSTLLVRGVATGVTTTARAIGSGVTFIVRGSASLIVSSVRVVGSGAGLIADTPPVTAMIKPSASVPVPTIDTISHTVVALDADTPEMATLPAAQVELPATAWPLHGAITTFFGVPHRPYQPIHTGIDISSGQRSGVTPIKPFRAGTVIDVVHSRSGLGNHVVVDHGNGLTSVYAHLHSISAQVGQQVDTASVLGHEGSTGVSTGTHLHLEIRQNGQPQNPQHYIEGRP